MAHVLTRPYEYPPPPYTAESAPLTVADKNEQDKRRLLADVSARIEVIGRRIAALEKQIAESSQLNESEGS